MLTVFIEDIIITVDGSFNILVCPNGKGMDIMYNIRKQNNDLQITAVHPPVSIDRIVITDDSTIRKAIHAFFTSHWDLMEVCKRFKVWKIMMGEYDNSDGLPTFNVIVKFNRQAEFVVEGAHHADDIVTITAKSTFVCTPDDQYVLMPGFAAKFGLVEQLTRALVAHKFKENSKESPGFNRGRNCV